jgi:hypothetical protein
MRMLFRRATALEEGNTQRCQNHDCNRSYRPNLHRRIRDEKSAEKYETRMTDESGDSDSFNRNPKPVVQLVETV